MKRRKHILICLGWYNTDIHRGISDFAKKHNWNLTNIENPEHLEHYTGCDGIITDLNSQAYRDWTIRNDIKSVKIGMDTHGIPCDAIAVDHSKISQMAADYFLRSGHKNFLWFTVWKQDRAHRHRYFQQWLGPNFDCPKIYHPTTLSTKIENNTFISVLKKQFPLAVFASDDLSASKLMNLCLDYDIKIPEEVSILGVHNDPLILGSVQIPISSIDVDFHRMGYLAANLLNRRIDKKTTKSRIFLIPPKKLVVRQSTDAIVVDHPEVLKALKFMKENFQNNITVKDIVLKTKFTECGLNKAFKEHLSLTIGQKLREFKIDYACELLRETKTPIKEVAIKSGFGDYHGFFEAFKRAKNVTPKQFRDS